MSWLEIGAILFNVVSVALVIANNKWNWYVGLVGVILLIIFFAQQELWGQTFIQVVFLLQTIHGVIAWEKNNGDIKYVEIRLIKWYDVMAFFVTVGVVLAMCLERVALDYLSAAVAMFATYLMARKFIVHWFMWIVVDIILIIMFVGMEMWGMVTLYTIFLLMCCVGAQRWSNLWVEQETKKLQANA
jgi:nicotinamide mononucleotide transporter